MHPEKVCVYVSMWCVCMCVCVCHRATAGMFQVKCFSLWLVSYTIHVHVYIHAVRAQKYKIYNRVAGVKSVLNILLTTVTSL